MSRNGFLYATIGFVIGGVFSASLITTVEITPEPDQLLLSEAVGALCANHEFVVDDLEPGVCREFCAILFDHEEQTQRCTKGYEVRIAENIAVENAMTDLP